MANGIITKSIVSKDGYTAELSYVEDGPNYYELYKSLPDTSTNFKILEMQDSGSSGLGSPIYNIIAAPNSEITIKYERRAGIGLEVLFYGESVLSISGGMSITFRMPDNCLDFPASGGAVALRKGSASFIYYKLTSFGVDTSEIESLRSQLDAANATIGSLNGQISTLISEKNSLQSQLNIANSNISTLNKQIEALNSQIIQLQATIEQLNATIQSKNEEIDDLKQQLEDALNGGESNSDALLAQIAQLTSNLNIAKQTIAAHEATIADLNKQISDKDAQIALLNKQIESLKQENQNLNSTINNLNNTITELNRQITVLKNQIANSGNSNSSLLEELAIAQEELVKLKADYEERIIAIEKKLSATYYLSSDNKSELETIKQSVVKDIMAQIGTPRFGIAPLPIGKQAIAATNELLSDPSTGHIYLKNKTGLVSKTKDNENRLNLMDDFIKSTWIAAIVDYSNYGEYTSSRDLYANSDGTFGSQTKIIALEKIPVKYSPMTEYIIAVKYVRGTLSKAVFVNDAGTELPCQKMYESNKTVTYKLYNDNVTAKTVYPKLTISTDTAIESILVYRTMSLKSLEEQDNSTFDPSLEPDNIVEGLYDKDKKEFSVNSSNKLKIMIPKDSIKCGHTNLIVVAKDNSATITCKTYFNNSFKESKDVNFSKITAVNSLKTGYARFEIPEMSNANNWLEITTTSSTNVVIKHIIFDTIGIDLDQYYTKTEINDNSTALQNTIVQQLTNTINTNVNNINTMIRKAGNNFGVTGGNGSSYSVSLPNVVASDLVNGFTVCIVPHVINNANCTLTVNSIGTYQIRNLNNELLEAEYIKAGVPILLVKYGNYFFIRARFNLNADGDDPTVKPGGGIDGPSKNEVMGDITGSVSTSTSVSVIRILAKNSVLARISYYGNNAVYQINLDTMAMKKVISDPNGDFNDMMRKWKDKYYIYGTKIYDLKYNQLKEFTKVTDPHYAKSKDDDKDEVTNYSVGRQDNTLILDSTDTNKLYYIELVPKEWDEYHQHRTNYDNCFHYERCDVRIYRVNDDFSLTQVMYYSNANYWNGSKIIAIKGNFMYCLVYNKVNTASNSNGVQALKVNMSDGTAVKPGSTTTDFGNKGSYAYLYSAPCRAYYTQSIEETQYGYLDPIHSQEINRYIKFTVDQTSGTSKHDYTYGYYYIYDIIDDREVNYASRTTTKKDGKSRNYYFIGDDISRDFVTNNPNVFSSYYRISENNYKRSLFGLVDKKNFSIQEININWEGHYTSKYRFTISMNGTKETINGTIHTKFTLNIKTWKL